jgi:multiple sugar transport system permease protein
MNGPTRRPAAEVAPTEVAPLGAAADRAPGTSAELRSPHADSRADAARKKLRSPRTSRRVRRPTNSLGWALLLLSPTLVLIGIYKYGPIGEALWASTKFFTVAGQAQQSVGTQNFHTALADSDFQHSLLLTVGFAVVKIPLQLGLGFGAALLLLRTSRVNSFLRMVMVVPAVTPIVIVGVIFLFLFDREIGLTNTLLQLVGVGKIGWLTRPDPAKFVIVAVSVWRDAGFTMLIYLAGLTAVPADVLEASRIDGCTGWQQVRLVIFPLLQRSTQLATVTTTIGAFQLFAPIFVLTRGGPQNATDVAAYHVYEQAFVFFNQGLANAMALVLVALLIVITGIELFLLRARWEY